MLKFTHEKALYRAEPSLRGSVGKWNVRRMDIFLPPPDPGFAYLGGTNLTRADLSNVTLSGANLIGPV